MKRKKYLIDFPVYTTDGSLTVQDGVSAMGFKNKGNVPLLLNQSYPLDPGESLSIPCQDDEEDSTFYRWSFNASGIGVPRPKICIVRKTYK